MEKRRAYQGHDWVRHPSRNHSAGGCYQALREYFDCCVVYYNQNWDRNLSTVFWEDFELKNTFGEYGPDILVPVVGENLGVTCGNILGRSYELLSELQPEGYLVLGDTNSCLSAISAKRLHIPLFHMEAGNRCKDECLPRKPTAASWM